MIRTKSTNIAFGLLLILICIFKMITIFISGYIVSIIGIGGEMNPILQYWYINEAIYTNVSLILVFIALLLINLYKTDTKMGIICTMVVLLIVFINLINDIYVLGVITNGQ